MTRPDPLEGLDALAFRRWNADRRGAIATMLLQVSAVAAAAIVAAELLVTVTVMGLAGTLPGDAGPWIAFASLAGWPIALVSALITAATLPWLWLRSRPIRVSLTPHLLHVGAQTVPLHDCTHVTSAPLAVHRRDTPPLTLPPGYELTPAAETTLIQALQDGIERNKAAIPVPEARQRLQQLTAGR